MKKLIILTFMGLSSVLAVSAKTDSLDFDKLSTSCQLVVENNNKKNQLLGKLEKLSSQLDSLKRDWANFCNDKMADASTTRETIEYLRDNTYSDIDGEQLLKDLDNKLKGDLPSAPQNTAPPYENSNETDEDEEYWRPDETEEESDGHTREINKEKKPDTKTDPQNLVRGNQNNKLN